MMNNILNKRLTSFLADSQRQVKRHFERLEDRFVFNSVPVITAIDVPNTSLEGSTIDFIITVTDADNEPATVTVSSLTGITPTGNPASGLLLLPPPFPNYPESPDSHLDYIGRFSQPVALGNNQFKLTLDLFDNYNGSINITLVAEDVGGQSIPLDYQYLGLIPLNDAPTATDSTQGYGGEFLDTVSGPLNAGDVADYNPQELTVIVTKQPQYGTVTFDDPNSPLVYTYTPNSADVVEDSFEYMIEDSGIPGPASSYPGYTPGTPLQSNIAKQSIRIVPTLNITDGVATIIGTSLDDNVFINYAGPNSIFVGYYTTKIFSETFQTSTLISGETIDLTEITKIVFDTLDGDDVVAINSYLYQGTITTTTMPATEIFTGSGNDLVILGGDHLDSVNNNVATGLFGSNGYTTFNGDLLVDTGTGNDQVYERSTIVNAKKQILLGDDDDRYDLYFSVSNDTVVEGGSGNDTAQIGYLTSRQVFVAGMSSGADLVSFYASRFNAGVSVTADIGSDVIAMDVNAYDNSIYVDTGADADSLLFSRSVGLSAAGIVNAVLLTGDGADTVYIGKYISGLAPNGSVVYSNGGSSVDRITLLTEGGADKIQMTANVIKQLFAYLGDGLDDLLVEDNILLGSSLIDGGLGSSKISKKNNSPSLQLINFMT